MSQVYRGRFAPSPTGPLHQGSLVAALASWLDARAHGGTWLVRIEDVDGPRCRAGMAEVILGQLATFGLQSDEPVMVQSRRVQTYQQALDTLAAAHLAYPCWCSRKDIDNALRRQGIATPRHGEQVYPGTCRPVTGDHGAGPGTSAPNAACQPEKRHKPPTPAWRLHTAIFESNRSAVPVSIDLAATHSVANSSIHWSDRRLGSQHQNVAQAVGDFPLKRADGCFTYQLAVVVDDAAQAITHVVRGEDLADNTARQIMLQQRLGLPTPLYLHTPLVLGANGEKLSKQNGAAALDLANPVATLCQAAAALGLQLGGWAGNANVHAIHPDTKPSLTLNRLLSDWVQQWRLLYNPAGEYHPEPHQSARPAEPSGPAKPAKPAQPGKP